MPKRFSVTIHTENNGDYETQTRISGELYEMYVCKHCNTLWDITARIKEHVKICKPE